MTVTRSRRRFRIRHAMIAIAGIGLALATWADSLRPGTVDPTRIVYGSFAGSWPTFLNKEVDPYSEIITAAPIACFAVLRAGRWACRGRRPAARVRIG